MKNSIKELKTFLILWSTQSLSQLGSAMTNFALTLWLYQKTGSALQTALLAVCSYAPYVLVSIFAGALSDRCGVLQRGGFCIVENGDAAAGSYVYSECGKRADEYPAAAGGGCGDDLDHAEKTLSEDKRAAVFLQFSGDDLKSGVCHRFICVCGVE